MAVGRGRRGPGACETLRAVQATYVALPIDEAVAAAFAELVAHRAPRGTSPKVQDTWIAATARAHDAAVYTQDSDFDDLAIDVEHV